MAVAVRRGIMHEDRHVEIAAFLVERPKLFRAEIGVGETAHEFHRLEAKSLYRPFELPA